MLRKLSPLLWVTTVFAGVQVPADAPARWAAWAGPDGIASGFTQERVEAFLEARRASVVMRGPMLAWLKQLSIAKTPSVRAWALARRLESGDFEAFNDYRQRMMEHLAGLSRPRVGPSDQAIQSPPYLPSALVIDQASPFWPSFQVTLRNALNEPLDASVYAVWCYGTAPNQRALILEEAAKVYAKVTPRNPKADPWNDPRFWIVADWVLAWGTAEDYAAIIQALPAGPARFEMEHIQDQVIKLTVKWPPQGSIQVPEALRSEAVEEPLGGGHRIQYLRVKARSMLLAYPEIAARRRLTSSVTVDITVGVDGVPLRTQLRPGPWLGFFGASTLANTMGWRFEPATMDGVPQQAVYHYALAYMMDH